MHWLAYVCIIMCSLPLIYGILESAPDTVMIADEENDADVTDALEIFKRSTSSNYYRRLVCRRWNNHCVPWSNQPQYECCYDQGLSCKCNLWMQNCRCLSRLWG